MTLANETATFLEADGWTVARRDRDVELISAKRAAFGDASDQVLVWCAPSTYQSEELTRREPSLLRTFAAEAKAPGQKFLLVESREGLSAEFQRRARLEFDINIRVPIQFFDAAFKWDNSTAGGSAAATAASGLRQRGIEADRRRTRQPYREAGSGASGDDLLAELSRRFRSLKEWTTPVLLVTAPAGFGKSMLFDALYARLYDDFIVAKGEQQRARRPLPLLPEYIPSAPAPTLQGLVDAFLHTEVARPVRRDSFEWMLTHGYACWLLDGLDEVISQDPSFFEYIQDICTRDNTAAPRILICVRDSLLSASQGLRDFVTEADEVITEFQLLPWEIESLTAFAKIRLVNQAQEFVATIEDRPNVRGLCGTPYYAELLAQRVEDSTSLQPWADDYEEIDLLDDAVRSIIEREYEKGVLQRAVIAPDEVLELVRDVAVMELESSARGVSVEEISELAAILLPGDMDDTDRASTITQLENLSLFRGATGRGEVRFTQDVVFEFLVGRRAGDYFRSNPTRFVQLLGWRPLPPDSIALRVLKSQIETAGASDELYSYLSSAASNPTAFRNLLQLVLILEKPARLLRQVPLGRHDLSGVNFKHLDLEDVSLRGCNLESTAFVGCNLQGCDLAEATLHATRFEDCTDSLLHAHWGSLSGFVSATIDGQFIDSVTEFLQLTGVQTEATRAAVGPCPTAMQLRGLFLKFVRPDGQARRDWLDQKAVLSGRRHVDPKEVLNGAVTFGFLTPDAKRNRYHRTRSQLYADMVGFVKSLQISPAVNSLLQETCAIPSCPHLVEVPERDPARPDAGS